VPEPATEKNLTDEEAMVEFQSGNAGAFDLLLKRHGSGLLRFNLCSIFR